MTTGSFVWHDLMTTDADGARGFYGELFGWRFEPLAMGPYTAWSIVAGDRRLGAVMPEASLPSSHWMPYVGVDDVDVACARVLQLGGDVCMAAIDVPALGRFAIAGDPQGGWFSLLGGPDGASPAPAINSFDFDELATSDPAAATTFYAVLFGWTFRAIEAGDATYRMIRHDGRDHAGVRAQASLDARPSWIPYLQVDDVDAAAARAQRLGGTVSVAPRELPAIGPVAVLADRTGATFAIRRAVTSR